MAMQTENPHVYGQWMIDDPQNRLLLTDKEGEESISMDFQVCQPQKTRVLCHLKHHSQIAIWLERHQRGAWNKNGIGRWPDYFSPPHAKNRLGTRLGTEPLCLWWGTHRSLFLQCQYYCQFLKSFKPVYIKISKFFTGLTNWHRDKTNCSFAHVRTE